jgi:hypothetical protein
LLTIFAVILVLLAIRGFFIILLWRNGYFSENVSIALGIDASAPCYGASENVRVLPVVISKFKLGNVKRHIFSAHFVRAEWSDDSVFNAEYRPKRTHRVTPGLTRGSMVTSGA